MRSRTAATLLTAVLLAGASTAVAAEMNPHLQPLAHLVGKTAGFYTTGTMSVEDGAIVSHEIVKGAAGGVAEVKATSRLLPDGRLHVKSRYLRNGVWEDGRETHYALDPTAVVRFKE
jgi:hypothetical protein